MNYILGKLLLNNLKIIYDNIKNNRIDFNDIILIMKKI